MGADACEQGPAPLVAEAGAQHRRQVRRPLRQVEHLQQVLAVQPLLLSLGVAAGRTDAVRPAGAASVDGQRSGGEAGRRLDSPGDQVAPDAVRSAPGRSLRRQRQDTATA